MLAYGDYVMVCVDFMVPCCLIDYDKDAQMLVSHS